MGFYKKVKESKEIPKNNHAKQDLNTHLRFFPALSSLYLQSTGLVSRACLARIRKGTEKTGEKKWRFQVVLSYLFNTGKISLNEIKEKKRNYKTAKS